MINSEKTLRRAVRKHPEDAAAWGALADFLAAHGRDDEAEDARLAAEFAPVLGPAGLRALGNGWSTLEGLWQLWHAIKMDMDAKEVSTKQAGKATRLLNRARITLAKRLAKSPKNLKAK